MEYQFDNSIEENINYLLDRTLEKESDSNIADDLSRKIMKVYENEGKKNIDSSLNKLKDQLEMEQNYCSMCYQEINNEYIHKLQNKLDEIIVKELTNNKVKKFKDKIEDKKIVQISFENDLELGDNFYSYFPQEQQKLKELIDEYNVLVKSTNNILEDKKDKLYTSINNELDGQLSEKYHEILDYINEINEKIDAHNKSLTDQDKLIFKATIENDKFTLYTYLKEFSSFFALYSEVRKIDNEEKNEKSSYNSLKTQINNENLTIQKLKSKMEQINIAVDEINKRINYITYTQGQIKIQAEDHKYYVLVNNEKIALEKLSTGQRNLISLSYFFTKINENYSEKEFYTNEILLVLDDPISSFDHSNRLGIMSLLRYEIGSILLSNEKSKILVQSHDTGVIFDLKKILDDIDEERKVNHSNLSNKIQYEVKEIRNHKDKPLINYQPEKTYRKLMTNIYMFGNGEFDNNKSQAELSIGNNIRRVLEAFSTFNYNSGITYLTNNDEVLSLLGSKDIQIYYKNLMNHLVLNSESHLKEKAESITDYNYMPQFSYNEKQKLARDTISFLYLLDRLHVKNNIITLSSKGNIENTIQSWIPKFNI